jgi:hypothetical protein
MVCTGFEPTTTWTPPTSSNAVGPRSISAPASIGPVARKRPLDTPRTVNSAANGRLPGYPDFPPKLILIFALVPAVCADCAACGSLMTPTTAFSAPCDTRARRISVVSPGPPPPGLSWESASITGPLASAASLMASVTASSALYSRPQNSLSRASISASRLSAAALTDILSNP